MIGCMTSHYLFVDQSPNKWSSTGNNATGQYSILRNLLVHAIMHHLWLRHKPPLKYAYTMYSGIYIRLDQYDGQPVRPTCNTLASWVGPTIRFFSFFVILLMAQVSLIPSFVFTDSACLSAVRPLSLVYHWTLCCIIQWVITGSGWLKCLSDFYACWQDLSLASQEASHFHGHGHFTFFISQNVPFPFVSSWGVLFLKAAST